MQIKNLEVAEREFIELERSVIDLQVNCEYHQVIGNNLLVIAAEIFIQYKICGVLSFVKVVCKECYE